MQYIQLGQSGLRVSRYVFGTLTFAGTKGFEAIGSAAGADARRQVDMALDAGVNMIDTANLYSRGDSEIVVGEALAGRRDKMLIATKVGFPMGEGLNDRGSSRAHLTDQVEQSLQRLKTDHIDLYFIHLWDGLTPVEETVAAMTDLIGAGKVRYWGVSNYNAWHLTKTVMTARAMGAIAPVCQQIYYTAEGREAEYELLPAAQDLGVSSMIWSPLGQGVLTGKVRRDQAAPAGSRQSANWPEPWVMSQERLFDVVDALEAVAGEIGATISQVALAWLAGRPDVGPIVVGARTDAQLGENLAAADIALTEAQADRIEAAARPAPLYPFWHRAMHALARATPAEAAYLSRHRRTLGLD
ncbi:MAG: aldo/keto reductase [Rhodospirillaceae bacterium]|nr:aldo/keto reductase [Rhodospirillaceae bacterium]